MLALFEDKLNLPKGSLDLPLPPSFTFDRGDDKRDPLSQRVYASILSRISDEKLASVVPLLSLFGSDSVSGKDIDDLYSMAQVLQG